MLGAAALARAVIFVLSNSVALLADLIHNVGDALTALPLGIAFFLRRFRSEKLAGLAVVFAIVVSACVALYEPVQRLSSHRRRRICACSQRPESSCFLGNALAAQVRLRAGRRLSSPGAYRRRQSRPCRRLRLAWRGASAIAVALGAQIGDPIVGLVITLVILEITRDSWRTATTTEPCELDEH